MQMISTPKLHYRLTSAGPMLADAFNINRLIGARVREERIRLGLTPISAGALVGVSRRTWSRYERGTIAPNAVILFAAGKAGFRVDYILGGPKA